MANNSFYITTPIYYVNDIPHIGHAYTSLACDVIARFMRLSGKEVKYLSGTDEHGQKVEKSAKQAGKPAQEFTDEMSEKFRQLLIKLNITNDDFIRTTELRHKQTVIKLWQKLKENGHIYLGKYSGWYATRDEAFYSESELTPDGKAPTGAPVEWVEETSYFFDLSKWQDKLLELYDNHPDFIFPQSRRNEVISFVKSGLNDLSISRTSFKWGIPVPNDDKHVIYVWLDALTNYITALGFADNNEDYYQFHSNTVHVVGKDILRFHAVYWPAFLMAAGLELPKAIVAHGWWTNEGQKISKSIGNTIDPLQLIENFGLDAVRYFLMREIIFGQDGNYSRQNLILRYNSELANKIGNLLQRTTVFIHKNCDSHLPTLDTEIIDRIYQTPLFTTVTEMPAKNLLLMENYDINGVLDNIISLTEKANIYIEQEAPWALQKNDPKRLEVVLYTLIEILRYISIMLQPFIPDSAAKMADQLNIPKEQRMFTHLTRKYAMLPGTRLNKSFPIFLRLEL